KSATGGSGRLDEIESVFKKIGKNTPAYVKLERVNQCLQDGLASALRGQLVKAAQHICRAIGTLFLSPRAMGSLLSPHTWRIVWVGQVLRRRATTAIVKSE